MHNVDDALNRAMRVLAIDAICKAEIERADLAIGEADEILKRIKGQVWGSPAGKTFVAKDLIRRFPEHKTYVEPFFGGGAVFWLKQASQSEVIGDVDEDITFALKFLKGCGDDQVKKLKRFDWTLTEELWRKLKSSKPTTPEARFHRMVMLRFGAFGRDVTSRGGVDRKAIGKSPDVFRKIEQARERLKKATIIGGDYRATMKKFDSPDTLFFLDPPYVKTGEKDKRGQGVGETKFDHDAFWKFLATVKGKVLVTYDVLPPDKRWRATKLTHRASAGRGSTEKYDTFVIDNFGATKKAAPVAKAPPAGTVIQTLIFDKAKFKTEAAVRKWVKDHDFKILSNPGIDETGSSWRVRQREPGDFQDGTLRTITITDGVKAVVGRLKRTTKTEEPQEFENVVRLLPVEKAEDEKRIVFGVVLEPGEVDAHGDTIDEDEIETAAHEWLAKYQNRGLMHRKLINAKIRIYESYIAPADLTIGGQRVKKGTWLLMYHILDDKIWQQVKSGKLRGFSMGGFARRVQMRAA